MEERAARKGAGAGRQAQPCGMAPDTPGNAPATVGRSPSSDSRHLGLQGESPIPQRRHQSTSRPGGPKTADCRWLASVLRQTIANAGCRRRGTMTNGVQRGGGGDRARPLPSSTLVVPPTSVIRFHAGPKAWTTQGTDRPQSGGATTWARECRAIRLTGSGRRPRSPCGGCSESGRRPAAGQSEPVAADAPMLELNPNDDYSECMLEILFNARQGIHAARRK